MADTHEYPFFTHRECPYFPCHDDIDPDDFNCLFCYCPLYALGMACKGRFRINRNGVKDCTGCSLPHRGDAGTRMVKERFPELKELTRERIAAALAAEAGEDGAEGAGQGEYDEDAEQGDGIDGIGCGSTSDAADGANAAASTNRESAR